MNFFLLAAFLIPGAAGAAMEMGSHQAPAESLARQATDKKRELLSDLWQRGLLPPDANSWSAQDLVLLERLHQAEAGDAVERLRRRSPNLHGLVLKDRLPSGRLRLRLTRNGFEQYLTLKTQEALDYFESKGVEIKWAYALTDLQGRDLFDKASGKLTDAGDELYSRVLANQPAFWKTREGEVMGNRAHPPRP